MFLSKGSKGRGEVPHAVSSAEAYLHMVRIMSTWCTVA